MKARGIALGLKGWIGIILVAFLVVGFSGPALADVQSGTEGLPVRVADEAYVFNVYNEEGTRFQQFVHRELLPESVRNFTKTGIAVHSTTPDNNKLLQAIPVINKYDYHDGSISSFAGRSGVIQIFTVFFNEKGTPLGYHLAKLNIGETGRFADVKPNHWAFQSINEMSDKKWLEGYPDGTFQPDKIVSRAEFAKIMVMASGLRLQPVTVPSFEDIAPTDWFTPYVEAAMPYLTGYLLPNGNVAYRPDEPALREDITIGIVKLMGLDVEASMDLGALEAMFSDYKAIAGVANRYIAAAIEKELVSGFPDGTFRPKEAITRAEAAALLNKAFPYGIDNKVEFPAATSPTKAAQPVYGPTVPNLGSINDGAYLTLAFDATKEMPLRKQIIYAIHGDTKSVTKRVYGEDQDVLVTIKPTAAVGGYSAYTSFSYTLDGQADWFKARFGSEGQPGDYVAVRIEVWGDGKKLYASGTIVQDAFIQVDVPVTGVKSLWIHVYPVLNGKSGAIAVMREGKLTQD